MWWAVGGIAFLFYFALMISLGVACLRNGHWFLFILGIFLPLFWILGAFMSPEVAVPRSPTG